MGPNFLQKGDFTMKNISLSEKVVLYVDENENIGFLHNNGNNKRAYINNDTVDLITYLINGNDIDAFFPKQLPLKTRDMLIKQASSTLLLLENENFITRIDQVNHGIIKKVGTNPSLRVAFIELTKKCNLMCKHCYVSDCTNAENKNEHKQLTFFDINNLIAQLDDIGIMEIQLTGGEPFILPYTISIIEKIQTNLIPCSVFTNGTLITDRIVNYVSTNNSGLIFYISLDGFEHTHDTFRNSQGAFKKTEQAIEMLLKCGCDVRINTSVGIHNIKELPQFMEYIKKKFSIMHRLVSVEPIGRANEEMTVTIEEFSNLLYATNNSLEFLDSHDLITDWSSPACGICSSMLFIDAYGNVTFCPTLTQRENPDFLAGNIYDSTIKEIWENSEIFNKFRGAQCKDIETCEFKELCKGGCRSRAYLSTGDMYSPDFAMCLLYEHKKNNA